MGAVMKKLLVFCSNPTDGGTAEMFVQCYIALEKNAEFDYDIVPCVNKGNHVKIFNTLENLVRLDVLSESQFCGAKKQTLCRHKRVVDKISRSLAYAHTQKSNINIMLNYIRSNDFDAVLIHNGGYVGDDLCNQMLKAAYLAGVSRKRVMVFHGTNESSLFTRARFLNYDMAINKYATDVVTGSSYSMTHLRNNTLIRRIRVLPNGISYDDTLSDEEKKKSIRYADADVNFVNVANFYHMKGQKHLLEAFNKMSKTTSKSVRLTLIGHATDEVYFNECIEYIRNNSLEKMVTIADNIYNSKEYMNLFDITVVSSLGGEDLPMVPIEAMRSGVPTIAYACNDIPEEVSNGKKGISGEVGKICGLSDAMKTLTEDTELRNKMGREALETYRSKFSGEAMGERYGKLIEES